MKDNVKKYIKRIKNDDFLFGEGGIIAFFGKDMVEDLKENDPKTYCFLRDDPAFMPSDVIRDDEE